jgi:Fic family protein
MILNNYLAMSRIRELTDRPLDEGLVLGLHRVLTEDAIDNPSAIGRFRRPDEAVAVSDDYGEVFHEPPPAEQLAGRFAALCDFANGKTPSKFVHPVIRAIILHFWLAYDHPFVDGNGRCARALFYWAMLRQGAWMCEFISISQLIRKAPARYGRAFLYTETDDNDLTYFILYHLDVIRKAFAELQDYIVRKAAALRETEKLVRASAAFNHRQLALLSHALRHADQQYTIRSHMTSHNVVYQTARTDLLDLARRGLLVQRKPGRALYFTPAQELEEKLRNSG